MRSKTCIRSWWLTRRKSPDLRKRMRNFAEILGAGAAGPGVAASASADGDSNTMGSRPTAKVEPKRSERAENSPPTPASILGSESSAAKPGEGREEALVSRVRCEPPKPAAQLTDQQ